MWTKVMLFFSAHFLLNNNTYYLCLYQAKRKQALLESNLLGIHLMDDKYFRSMGCQNDGPL